MGQADHDADGGIDEEPAAAPRADAQEAVRPLDVRLMDRRAGHGKPSIANPRNDWDRSRAGRSPERNGAMASTEPP